MNSEPAAWLQRLQASAAPGEPAQPAAPGAEDGLGRLIRTLRRRRHVALISAASVSISLALWSVGQRLFNPVYEGRFELQIANPMDAPQGRSNGGGGDQNSGVVEAIARSTSGTNLANMVRLLGSPLVLGSVANTAAVPLDAVMAGLQIRLPNEDVNQVLEVSLRWPDPVQGAHVLEALAQRYVNFSKEQRQQALDAGMRFLDQQAPDLQARVDALQDQLKDFRVRNGFLDPLSQSQSLQQSRDGLAGELRNLQLRQAQLDSLARAIRGGRLLPQELSAPLADQQLGPASLATAPRRSPQDTAASTTGANTPLAELQQIEKDLATARATYRDSTPLVRSLLARRAQLRPVVQRQSLDAVKSALWLNSAQQNELNRQMLLLNQRFKISPERVKDYETLQQRLSVARDSYASYIRARETYRLEQARSTSPWTVIAPPRFNPRPVTPDLQQGLLQALLLGGVAGMGAALLRERTDPLLHTSEQLESALGHPLLGVMPHWPGGTALPLNQRLSELPPEAGLALRESLRHVNTRLRDLQRSSGARLVGITSTTAGEGRSAAVAALAQTMAELGVRVLVVDGDLRLSCQHQLLGLAGPGQASPMGLADALSDATLALEPLITAVGPGLDLLPAGRQLSDPALQLHTAQWPQRLAQLRALTHYDLILFDTAAAELLSDTTQMGAGLDGLVFVVGLSAVERHRAQLACRRLQHSGATLLGVLANQAMPPSHLSEETPGSGLWWHHKANGARAWASRGQSAAAAAEA